MKTILMALAITAMTCAGAEAQTKKTGQGKETCTLSADQKTVTCCKTMPNPAYDIKGKTAAVKKPAPKKTAFGPRPARKTYYVKDYQVCKDEGGYYTCCLYENTYRTTVDGE